MSETEYRVQSSEYRVQSTEFSGIGEYLPSLYML